MVLGAACGEAVLGKKIGNKALVWGAVAGTIPDLDVMANFFMGELDSLAFHRGPMHSLLFAGLMPFLLSWLVLKFYKSGIYNNRFVLRYNETVLSNPSFDPNTILIYTDSDKIYINSGIELISSYEIYDVLGRVLVSSKNLSSNQIVSELQPTNQPLVVRVKLDNNQFISKKIIH